MKKILYIAPHLSTGGMPQYLLRIIKEMIDDCDMYVVEYKCISNQYTVQREKIKHALSIGVAGRITKKFYTLLNKFELLKIIEEQKPDIVHLQEIPELFMDDVVAEKIYKPDRDYIIIETSHTVNFQPIRKKYYPDEFMFVCEYQKRQYTPYFSIPKHVVEYPVELNKPLIKKDCAENLQWDVNKKHILIVGLFTPDKNQRYAFEIAKFMPEVQFHFVGNLATNFKHYWEPILKTRPTNCFIHKERNDLSIWYSACDLVLFPSFNPNKPAECNPLVIKEALSWQRKIHLFRLAPYLDKYDNEPNVSYLLGKAHMDARLIRMDLGL